ncbi:MAG: Apolipoprotein N-acyltransferase, partial [Labilithrix sp.]|nr:Apolipoprotein N-acyltransferase [Labilithrix sp.]
MARFTPLPAVAGWLALVLLSAAQALPWTLGGALAAWLAHPRPDTRPAAMRGFLAFAIGIYAATFVPAVFPWTPSGGLARWPILLQTAELVGERGTTFLVAIACALLAEAVPQGVRRERPLAAGIGLFALLALYGVLRMRSVEALRSAAPHAKVALLQPDFDATFRWDERRASSMVDRLSALTRRAEEAGAILTIWPESAYPYTLAHGVKSSPHGSRGVLQQGVRGPVLTGVYLSKGGGLGTNSAILVQPSGDIGPSYDKRHLLWFGETVPLADTFPVLRRVFARGTGLAPGNETVAFRSGPIVATVLNCYEDTLPQAGREAMEPRPNLLVNITNDAWFAGSAEGELHLRLAVLRSIEARRELVRAVNRGPTTWVDATGRIVARSDPTPGLGASPPLLADVPLLEAPVTLYTRAGDAPLVLVVLGLVLTTWIRRRSL